MTDHVARPQPSRTGKVDGPPPRGGRFALIFPTLWLAFLIEPWLAAWRHRGELRGILGLLLVVLFVAVYLATWRWLRRQRHLLVERPPLSVASGLFGLLLALGGVLTLVVGETGVVSLTYCGAVAVMLFPGRLAAPVVAGLAGLAAASGLVPGWDSQLGTTFAVLAASLAVFGITRLFSTNIALARAQQDNARLAVEGERARFSRDLHDILGHSLTVITVKAELANRLLDVDPERARAELIDLEALSREALRDVRSAVEGYRDLSLSGELTRARHALAAAGVRADLPGNVEVVAPELRELFAWAVRETVTNVIRHSGADRCSITVAADRLRVCDDGRGRAAAGSDGAGLNGLRERAAQAGAIVVLDSERTGFAVEVIRT